MRKLPRRFLLSVLVLVGVFALLIGNSWRPAPALAATAAAYPTAGTLTSTSSQTTQSYAGPNEVYFPDFQHFVANPFLHYWRATGHTDIFGGPVSEAYLNNKGQYVQFFQKLAIMYDPNETNAALQIRPYEIGRIFYEAQPASVKNAAPYAPVAAIANTSTQQFFSQTGHTLNGDFLKLFNAQGGIAFWGYPLSEAYTLVMVDGSVYTAQLFERGRMLSSSTTGTIIDPEFGKLMATFNQADTTPIVNTNTSIPNYDSRLWEHWVDVNLTTQSETFYEGDIPVRTNLVTTGVPGDDTPTGTFHILRRVYNEHMVGGSKATGDYYNLYNVLYTMYFTNEGHALHYAWWRSYFGVTGSHGCVNEDYDTALFAWNYMTIGDRVQIHY